MMLELVQEARKLAELAEKYREDAGKHELTMHYLQQTLGRLEKRVRRHGPKS